MKRRDILLPAKRVARRMGIYLMKRRCELVIPWLKGDVLDIGCGLGYLAHFVGEGQRYVGIDINEELISLLKREHINCPNREFWCVDVNKDITPSLPFLNSAFDTIALLAAIEHLGNPERVLSLSRRLLKDEGLLLLTTPTQLGDKVGCLISMLGSGTRALPYPHMRIYNRASLTAIVEQSGFQVSTYRKFELGMNQLFICSKGSSQW